MMSDLSAICTKCSHELGQHSPVLGGCSVIISEEEGGATYCQCNPFSIDTVGVGGGHDHHQWHLDRMKKQRDVRHRRRMR